MAKVWENRSETIREIPVACADEDAAVAFMEKQRWGGEPWCPRSGCGSTDVYRMTGDSARKRYLWRCRSCKQQFTVRVGTIMEDSRIPLRHWCYAFWAACASKKGVSALQIQRQTGLSYKSALFMMHRIPLRHGGRFARPNGRHRGGKMTDNTENDSETEPTPARPGPVEQRLSIDSPWEDAVSKVVQKGNPPKQPRKDHKKRPKA